MNGKYIFYTDHAEVFRWNFITSKLINISRNFDELGEDKPRIKSIQVSRNGQYLLTKDAFVSILDMGYEYKSVYSEINKSDIYLLGNSILIILKHCKIKCIQIESGDLKFKLENTTYFSSPIMFLSGDEKLLLIYDDEERMNASLYNLEEQRLNGHFSKWVGLSKFYLLSTMNNGVEAFRMLTMSIDRKKRFDN